MTSGEKPLNSQFGLDRPVKILLVDDVELFLELEKSFFRRADIDLLVARNGEEALELMKQEQPDLVFLDLYMPGLNGDEVCRAIKQNQQMQKIPVIMVLQPGSSDDNERCQTAGCNEILYKPVRREDFIAAASRNLPLAERAHPRFDFQLKVSFGLQPEKPLENFTVNVSEGGLFIATGAILTVGTELNLEFHLPLQGECIACTGRVAWVNHPDWLKKPKLPVGMGIEFVDIDDERKKKIRSLIEQA